MARALTHRSQTRQLGRVRRLLSSRPLAEPALYAVRAVTMDDLEPELRDVGMRLERERPLPQPAFRGDLGRRLAGRRAAPAPRNLRLLMAGQLGFGALLLVVTAVCVLADVGPLSL